MRTVREEDVKGSGTAWRFECVAGGGRERAERSIGAAGVRAAIVCLGRFVGGFPAVGRVVEALNRIGLFAGYFGLNWDVSRLS